MGRINRWRSTIAYVILAGVVAGLVLAIVQYGRDWGWRR